MKKKGQEKRRRNALERLKNDLSWWERNSYARLLAQNDWSTQARQIGRIKTEISVLELRLGLAQ